MKQVLKAYVIIFIAVTMGNLSALIIDHNCVSLPLIPASAIQQAKSSLHIAYTHTSHGSQITTGMADLDTFMGGTGLYAWNDGPLAGSLDIDDYAMGSTDLGHEGDLSWYYQTIDYLDNPANSRINVMMWSWCGGCSDNTSAGINTYLNAMNQLETAYPAIKFIYMTGHLDIWSDANLKARNQQIRTYCINNNKILYDFADIESYNPEGVFYQYATDSCEYYADTYGNTWLGNWGTDWQTAYPTEWYNCEAQHTEPVNANLKAYAAWWMWARLAGWNAQVTSDRFAYHTTAARNYATVGVGMQFSGVGNNTATKMTMAKISGSPGTYGTLPTDITQISNTAYWTLHSSRGNVGNYSLTLNLSGVVSAADFPDICILKRNTDNTAWTNVSSYISNRTYPNITLSGLSSFGDFVTATGATLASPVIQNITYSANRIYVQWQPISGATSYLVKSATSPDGTFTTDTGGIFAGTTWSCPATAGKKFFRVVARN
ncbi:MAG: hypothetical protein CVU50_04940 [Candidatus Cloacimonetes bacterium HGW-Cloacimonetes-3]|nr:MAG: hypothetical protein CVU50_04940 [Candidatus Cloacimonetes bacterium HGW-Cloacimonetes-3]